MNFFLHKILNHKKYLTIVFFTLLLSGILFGLYEYQYCSNNIISFFRTLFFVKKEQTEYSLYLIQNILIIFFVTYLNSSYIGFIGAFFIVFLKGIQISFSLIYILSFNLSPLLILIVIIQLLLEIILLLLLFFPNVLLSIQTLIVTFITEDNYNFKSILNYNLNSLIIILIVFVVSLLIRVNLINII